MTSWGALGSDAPRTPRRRAPRKPAMAVDVPTGCPLSPSEYGVIRQLALGLTYKQMALASGLSVSTIRTHIHHAYTKLEVVDRAQAVLKCAREGWLDEAVEIGDVEKPDPLRGFAREYLDAFDTHILEPDDEEAARCLAVSAEGLGLGRLHRDRTTRNDFIDAVIDGMAYGRRQRRANVAATAVAEIDAAAESTGVDYAKIARLEAELLDTDREELSA